MFHNIRINISRLVFLAFVVCLFIPTTVSCLKKNEVVIESTYNPDVVPTIKTHNDTMYISDSGRIRFKVIAETMLLFDKAKEPHTLWPNRAYMEQYDSLKNIITTLRADSVWNYSKKKLWKLQGNVSIVNIEGKTFDSEELFWDEQKDRIYSDRYVTIQEPLKTTIRAYGFESNQSMTEYTFRRATDVDLYISEEEEENREL